MPPSVIVVGGGIIGCATAYDLAKAGSKVTLFERAIPGAEASSAAAGLLTVGGTRRAEPFQKLALDSWARYPDIARELRDVTGVDVEHMTAGTLYPLFDRDEAAEAEGPLRSPCIFPWSPCADRWWRSATCPRCSATPCTATRAISRRGHQASC